MNKEYYDKQIEKAYIKGGITGILVTFILLGIFTFITIIEMI